MGKPRMTQRDKWKKRPATSAYWRYKDQIQKMGVTLPESGYHVIFVLPMPVSWSKKKRAEYAGKPHQQKPDKDNLEKALLDSIFEDDCRIWDGRVTKVWGETGQIIIRETA
ncbi:RusA family crossover junction endodeoxyribonuclease [Phytobacter sp. V91]|uniref:RusA family crossover junction endodeoxyribonuclease n=1 Tax=Phytobacter sp. V91 TaxID=3369425 RepID=UPI003F5E5FBE